MTDDMKPRKLNILVLFAGAGLATRGLLDAGHSCTDVEIDPAKSHLSRLLNPEAKHIVSDVRDLDSGFIASFDAVWASPPCQERSEGNTTIVDYMPDLLQWSLDLPNDILWVENVVSYNSSNNAWGTLWNAAQFEQTPRQNRPRVIGGRHRQPRQVYRYYSHDYISATCSPTITASEIKGCATDSRRASRWYGRRLSIREVAYHQGVTIPEHIINNWWYPLPGYGDRAWREQLYEGIGNGVPVYMAKAFGEAYSKPELGNWQPMQQLELFEAI